MITLQEEGRRIYFVGNTYPIKDQIKGAGGKWDPERKAWYIGVQRREVAESIVTQVAAAPTTPAAENGSGDQRPVERLAEDAREIAGRATYKGHSYYVLGRVVRGRTRWDDTIVVTQSQRGAYRLAYRDGSRIFWADGAGFTIDKTYPRLASIASLVKYAQEAKQR